MTTTTLPRPAARPAVPQPGRHRQGARAESVALGSPALGRAARIGRAPVTADRAEQPVAPVADEVPGRLAGRHAARGRVGAHRVAGRVLGMVLASVAVTYGLASQSLSAGTSSLEEVAGFSIPGVATSAVISTAWAYQDRRALGAWRTVRCWVAVAVGVGLAHGLWLAVLVPGPLSEDVPTRAWTAAVTLALDTLLVVAPALLGSRAAAPATEAAGTVVPAVPVPVEATARA